MSNDMQTQRGIALEEFRDLVECESLAAQLQQAVVFRRAKREHLIPELAGPRHLTFHPNGKFVYVINELNSSVSAFRYNADKGTLALFQNTSTLPKNATAKLKSENTCAEVVVHPSGKFLYTSNRGSDTIAMFSVEHRGGRLTLVANVPTGGKEPRHFTIDPSGSYLLAENQNSNNIAILRVDPKRGTLQPTGTMVPVPSPVCVVFATSR